MVQAQILRLIGELVTEQGISLLMISHDLAVLAEHCDRLAGMFSGHKKHARAATAFASVWASVERRRAGFTCTTTDSPFDDKVFRCKWASAASPSLNAGQVLRRRVKSASIRRRKGSSIPESI